MSAVEDDPRVRRLVDEHKGYADRLAEIESYRFPTEDERTEKTTLKKLKLRVKDRIQLLVHHE